MENIINIKNIILAGMAAVGSTVATLLGGWDGSLRALLIAMALDYVTGLIVAGVFHRSTKSEGGALESRAGFKGLVRKCGILALVLLGALLDNLTGKAFIRTAVCLFFVANEGLSVIENLLLMGVPCPAFLKRALEVMKQQGDKGGEANGTNQS